MTPLLSIENLSIEFQDHRETRALLRNVSLELRKGEILGLVGESGSGKSLLCRAVMGLLPSPKLVPTQGDIRLNDTPILGLPQKAMTQLRGRQIGMIFQNPTSHLDPVMRIGDQICEGLRTHKGLSKSDARKESIELLNQVGFPDPARGFSSYAHEFSGGMRQRAMIAIALSCDPDILIADEPTTALDVTIQAQILRLLIDLREQRGLSIILITHDLGVVAQTCDRIAVMQDGEVVESGEKHGLLASPAHPYTQKLIASHPSHESELTPTAESNEARQPLFVVDNLGVTFPGAGGLFQKRQPFHAVQDVSLKVFAGDTIGIVGESGSGKSTLARAMIGLNHVSSGQVAYDGAVLTQEPTKTLPHVRSEVAMVFQDPFNALNPRQTVRNILEEVLQTQGQTPKARIQPRAEELLTLVGLDPSFADRLPRSLSGGQCQRVGIARALAVDPKVVIADECVAALDVTIQAQIVALFKELSETLGLTLVFIAHDLAIVRQLCDRVVVMQHGRIVETGPTAKIFANPTQTYTADLISAIPNIDPNRPLREHQTTGAQSG